MSKANLQAHLSNNASKVVRSASSYKKRRSQSTEPDPRISMAPKPRGPTRISDA